MTCPVHGPSIDELCVAYCGAEDLSRRGMVGGEIPSQAPLGVSHETPRRDENNQRSQEVEMKIGLAPDQYLERTAGSRDHRAIILTNLHNAVDATAAEWEYDDLPEAVELVRLCGELTDHLGRLSLEENGSLTLYRECARCSGDGKTQGEDPCIECGGTGAVHADEADG